MAQQLPLTHRSLTMIIVNLTPHPLNIFLPAQVEREGRTLKVAKNAEAVVSLLSTGFARAEEIVEELPVLEHNGILLPVVRRRFASVVIGLPTPQEGTIYVVSFLTAQAVPGRKDVFFPGEALRDDTGNIVGCVGLAHV